MERYELGQFDERAYQQGRILVDDLNEGLQIPADVANTVTVAIFANGFLQFAGADATLGRINRADVRTAAVRIAKRMNPDGELDKLDKARNCNQIDNTDYYRLPCGRYLEDFIAWRELDFATGNAVKYCWRAGRKDGESKSKDLAKAEHYIRFVSMRTSLTPEMDAATRQRINGYVDEAWLWNGDDSEPCE